MKHIYFTVGPSQVYPTLYKHLSQAVKEEIASLNHRGTEFKHLFKDTVDNLKKLLNIPKDYQIFFVSSALEAMERTSLGCVSSTSYHLISGAFGTAWANYTTQLGKNAIKQQFTLTEEIKIKIPTAAEIICITQNDTSTGTWIPMHYIYQLKKLYPAKIIAIDTVSSVPFVDIDYQYIDVMFFSVQKGFGLPPGLGVMVVSPDALEKSEKIVKKGISIGSYHSLKNLSQKALEFQTPETPNLLNIYLLNQIIKDMLKRGIKSIRQETDKKAKLIYDFFEEHPKYRPFIPELKFRSPTSLVIDVKGDSEQIRQKLFKHNFVIGAGYGENKLNHIRIANFPAHSLENVSAMLKYF